ncbi:MAG: helix-turn-helix domain-containing protein [Lachnospiraceae bacterium]|nr:helix-turn-helix domain-containing protein [Lachnospiraceae bacterium]
MQNIELLMLALEYIEVHLCDEIKTEDVAAFCFCSKSTLEKLFRSVHDISIHDYIVRRRMMLAAKKLSQELQMSILDIALEYGYSTHESFARAFEQVWNCKPSEFRKAKFTELFPRLNVPPSKGDNYIMQRKHVDISELYDLFQERKDCYFVVCDIKHMIPINEISRKAGDLAILEQMRRMTAAAGEDDIVFRIGGDEFCILTASKELPYANQIADKIRSVNEHTFSYQDREIPLTLYVAVVSLKECSRYEEVFAGLHNAIKESKTY